MSYSLREKFERPEHFARILERKRKQEYGYPLEVVPGVRILRKKGYDVYLDVMKGPPYRWVGHDSLRAK